MTELPRVMISMPPDIENAVKNLKAQPGNERVPTSKLLCRLIRRGMGRETGAKNEQTRPISSG